MNSTNVTVEDGPSFYEVGMPAILITICLVGIVGNASVIYVVCRNRQMNVLFMNLAIADLLFNVFCIPIRAALFATSYQLRLGRFLCKTSTYATYVSMGVSIYSLVAICVLRFAGIKYPLHLRQMLGRTTAYKASIAAWVVMLVLNIPLLVLYGEDSEYNCSIIYKGQWVYELYVSVTFGIDFALPAVIVAILSTLIVVQVWTIRDESRSLGISTVKSDGFYRASKRASKRLMILVILVFMIFIVCWGPLHALFLWNVLRMDEHGNARPDTRPNQLKQLTEYIQTAAIILAFANSSVNPILYNFVSKEFRLAFIRALWPCRRHALAIGNSSTKRTSMSYRSKQRLSDDSENEPLPLKHFQGNNSMD
ncbi:allatostatin-A receptor-like [Lingula anatina]|uniref:Allatostatin-A receptor-like n=1 Tax=Lingula anatina TaxID=7574 RepID=A0A1S3J3E6_LINAN|nr:allatostatin-A receptor-like [Lingula anatina]|eukprot:XP_013404791.1 allatostatin-A receptor-like [Lingula anatina]